MDRVQAAALRRRGVRLDIVDIDGALRLDREAFDEQRKNPRVRFDQPDFAGNENASEPVQKLEARPRQRIGLGRPVGEAVERRIAISKLGQDLDRARQSK